MKKFNAKTYVNVYLESRKYETMLLIILKLLDAIINKMEEEPPSGIL